MNADIIMLGSIVVCLLSTSTGASSTFSNVMKHFCSMYGLFFGTVLQVIFVPGVAVAIIHILDFHNEEEPSGYSDEGLGLLLATACPVSISVLGLLTNVEADMELATCITAVNKAVGVLFFPLSFWLWTLGSDCMVPLTSLLVSGGMAVGGLAVGMLLRRQLEDHVIWAFEWLGRCGQLFVLVLIITLCVGNKEIFEISGDVWFAVMLHQVISMGVSIIFLKGIGFKMNENVVLACSASMKNSLLALPIATGEGLEIIFSTLIIYAVMTNLMGYLFFLIWRFCQTSDLDFVLHKPKKSSPFRSKRKGAKSSANYSTLLPKRRSKLPHNTGIQAETPGEETVEVCDSTKVQKHYRPDSYGSTESNTPPAGNAHGSGPDIVNRTRFTQKCLAEGGPKPRIEDICAELEREEEQTPPARVLSGIRNPTFINHEDLVRKPCRSQTYPGRAIRAHKRASFEAGTIVEHASKSSSNVVTKVVLAPLSARRTAADSRKRISDSWGGIKDSIKVSRERLGSVYIRDKQGSNGRVKKPPYLGKLEVSNLPWSGASSAATTNSTLSSQTTPGSGSILDRYNHNLSTGQSALDRGVDLRENQNKSRVRQFLEDRGKGKLMRTKEWEKDSLGCRPSTYHRQNLKLLRAKLYNTQAEDFSSHRSHTHKINYLPQRRKSKTKQSANYAPSVSSNPIYKRSYRALRKPRKLGRGKGEVWKGPNGDTLTVKTAPIKKAGSHRIEISRPV